MSYQTLDPVVLNRDLPAHGLRTGDLGTIVQLHDPETFDVEFVLVSGETQTLVTLSAPDLRPVDQDDLVAVRHCPPTPTARG